MSNQVTRQAPILEVDHLNVKYGTFTAVRGISFEVAGGEIFGLLGPNGAGKTSTLSAIEGLLKPTAGAISVCGFDIAAKPLHARANMGVQLQATSFQQELTITEIVRLYARIYGVAITEDEIREKLASINLADAAGKKIAQLSGGQQQRVSLLISTIHNPRLILLDEPTTGLDPQSRRYLWQRIEQFRDLGHAVVITTHSMEEAEAVCDRIAIIDHGSIIAIDSPAALIERNLNNPAVLEVVRKGKVTLEDVFIGLTGSAIRS
ncbi:ABC-2 type transport system ATP-binding protein [Chitinophaga terrae (ex Kim and Jung 2007)]|uniref:ABC transporter ATP-binding protein n=1 Tax=Chitinophaga terrae (ex Kim and Jung 2007) TaxID=408074 RepID=UPI002789C051|nr:ABC transporter ATP-binding protein [Chitinophaga terrae (ex Kim and Jung 2007)]MDQ0108736.1 ABC-2 type transport system ATP-binding protein [Chitinophaga terrae (ex Kim and Jung 2007)]